MKVEISNEATQRIVEAIGKADPSTITMIFERVTEDRELLVGLAEEEVPVADISAIKEGVAEYRAGKIKNFEEVDAEIRDQLGFKKRP